MLLLLLAACDGGLVATPGAFFGDTGGSGDSGAEIVDLERGFALYCRGRLLQVEALSDGVVRLRYGDEPERPSWAVVDDTPVGDPPSVVVYSDVVALRTAALTVLVDPVSCALTVEEPDRAVLLEAGSGAGFSGDATGRTLTRALDPGERIYGLGERTGALDRVGGTYTCWNTDAYEDAHGGWGPTADPLYQCIPFYVSLRSGRATGVFTDVTWRSETDVGAADPNTLSFTTEPGDTLDQYVIAGPSFGEVLDRYTALTGRPALPPRWALGFHQSRWGWADEGVVRDVVDGFRARDLPLDAVWLDIQHMDGFRSYTWDPVNFPDPGGLVADLAADGVRAVAIVDPALKVDPDWDVYAEGVADGHFLMDGDAPWVGEVWPGDSVFPDFSRPETRAWWGGLAEADLGHGLAGLWLDMNEPAEFSLGTVPDSLPADGDGVATTMAEVHNVYALLEAQATWEGWRALAPEDRPFLITRAGYAGIQRYAGAWTGDAPSTWDSLATTLPMLLGMGTSGEPLVGSDVGGYSGGATAELYARWMQVGVFSPFFRAHLVQGAADQYPWSFGQEVLDITRGALELRASLVPYLYSLAWEAHLTGAPILRPLVWAYPDDADAAAIGDQALLGDALLVAPVLAEGATSRSVYLPEGRWYEFTTGVAFDGPTTLTRADLPLAALPIFVREGAIVPRGPVDGGAAAAPDPLTLELWPAEGATTFTLHEDDGLTYGGASAATTYTLVGDDGGASLSAARAGGYDPGARTLHVRIRRVDHAPTAVTLDGAALTELDAPRDVASARTTGWWWDPVDLSLWVVLPDAASFSLSFRYDPSLSALAPPVAMPFRVTLPADTPTDTPISIASSADGWASHTPLERLSATEAYGTIEVPRGEYVYYKYTRGDWDTVEKWPGCEEASNRYELGRAQEKADTVYAWRDACE